MKETVPTIGGDPEFFIYGKVKDKYEVIPADKVLPSKENKETVSYGYGSIFFDGVQAEINPMQHACREIFARNIKRCLEAAYSKAISKYSKRDIEFAPLGSIEVNLKDMEGCDKECFRFGCSPDSCIYDSPKIKYPDGKKFNIRFSGGHIHLGFDDLIYMKKMKDVDRMMDLLKVLDIIPGIMSVCFSHGKEEVVRREWYGQAGKYRIQPHGLEYRTPSSFWLVSPAMVSLYTSLVRDSFSIVYNDRQKDLFDKVDINRIRKIIDNVDYEKAKNIYSKVIKPYYETEFVGMTGSPMKFVYIREFVDKMVNKGYQHIFNPMAMLHYWSIKEPTIERYYNMVHGVRHFARNLKNKRFTIEEIRNLGDVEWKK